MPKLDDELGLDEYINEIQAKMLDYSTVAAKIPTIAEKFDTGGLELEDITMVLAETESAFEELSVYAKEIGKLRKAANIAAASKKVARETHVSLTNF